MLPWLLVLAVLGGAGYALWHYQAAAPAQRGPRGGPAGNAVPVGVATVSRQDVPVMLEGLGTVQAFQSVVIRAQVDGQLLELPFTEGQEISKGTVLARIDPRSFQAALDQAAAKKRQDEANLANARIDLARYAKLAATARIQQVAVVAHRAQLLLKPGVEADEIRGALKARQLDAQSVASRQADLIKGAEGIAQFLGLTGLAALLLGGLGVAAAAHTYAQERAREVALLRCLGATGGEAVLVPLFQVGVLTDLAAGLGALGGTALAALAGPALRHWLAVEMPRSASLGVALEGGLTGLACGLLFALGPLLALRRVPPLAGLRAGTASPAGRGGAGRWIGGLIALAVLAYAVRQAAVWWHGVLFAAGLGLALGLLAGAALLLRRVGRALARRGGPFALRQAAANLYRPQNQTVVLVVSLGLGVWLLATQQFAAATLLRPLRLPACWLRQLVHLPNLHFVPHWNARG